MTWELILDGYSENSYSAPRFAATRLPWFKSRLIKIIRLP
ncbi:invasion protein [Escherichia coli]|nr:invasion protein [Escherichia coli]